MTEGVVSRFEIARIYGFMSKFNRYMLEDGRMTRNRSSPWGRWEILQKLVCLPMGDGRSIQNHPSPSGRLGDSDFLPPPCGLWMAVQRRECRVSPHVTILQPFGTIDCECISWMRTWIDMILKLSCSTLSKQHSKCTAFPGVEIKRVSLLNYMDEDLDLDGGVWRIFIYHILYKYFWHLDT